jgi:rSAM/selenodomain-associated transferase 1
MKSDDRLIIFVKWPEKGKVKTRLAASFGEDETLELYRCFVRDTIEMAEQSGFSPLISYYPEDAGKEVREWLGDEREYLPQSGNDIGARMGNAFRLAFDQGSTTAVLIGSDFPDLPAEIIIEAFSALESNRAVIGPAKDGGYYLIGFRRDTFDAGIFEDIPWSTAEVFERTVSIAAGAGIEIYRLPVWRDIDRPEDIADLIGQNTGKPFMQSRTMKFLKKTPLWLHSGF